MLRHDRWARLAVIALLPLLAVACGGESTPITPTPTTYTLTVQVRDAGQRTVAGALVRITDGLNAGRNATSDQNGQASLTGLSAGGFTIEVTASGYGQTTQPVTLSSSISVTVELKLTPNTPPVITSLVAKGTFANAPANYSEAGEPLTVTVAVSDPETATDKMTFEWKADSGTITGEGPIVKWQPASTGSGSGANASITVTVVEKYGPSNTLENRASSSVSVAVRNGAKEVSDMAYDFLVMFSNSNITDPEVVLRDFSKTCPGTSSERDDVLKNRREYTIQSYTIGTPSVRVNFGGICSFRSRPGDACAAVPAEWHSLSKIVGDPNYGKVVTSKGTDQVTGVYQGGRWWLCESDFESAQSSSAYGRFKK